MKTLFAFFLLSCCGIVSLSAAKAAPFDQTYGYELIRYLYRWHMDDAVLAETLEKTDTIDLHYRYLEPTRDAGDVSEYLEIVFPLTKMVVLLKRSEYTIEKLNLELKDPYFKVQSAQHYRNLEWDASQYELLRYDYDEAMAYLFRTRNDQHFPDEVTLSRLRAEARRVFEAEGHHADSMGVDEPLQIAYVAPVSVVSNDLWFYWVNGRKFICFSADLHHSHPRFWEFANLDVEIIDADEQIVVSQVEKSAHGYFTKDYVGRILFNCIIHGKQVRYAEGRVVDVVGN
jgi:hypothetical protein